MGKKATAKPAASAQSQERLVGAPTAETTTTAPATTAPAQPEATPTPETVQPEATPTPEQPQSEAPQKLIEIGDMPLYRGTKELLAFPMTRGLYNVYRGWTLPEGENADDAGYLVEYVDGGKPNDERHKGYISWSPADVFERTYKLVDTEAEANDAKRENAENFADRAADQRERTQQADARADYAQAVENEVDSVRVLLNGGEPLQLRFADGSSFIPDAEPRPVSPSDLQGLGARVTYEKVVDFAPGGTPFAVTEAWLIGGDQAMRCSLTMALPIGGGTAAQLPAGHLIF